MLSNILITVLFKNMRTLKFKSHLVFFAAINHNYDHKQQTLKHKNTKRIKIHQSQTMTFWTYWSKLLFPKRSAKMIDNSEKRKRQLAFELWNSCVYEKRSNSDCILTNSFFRPP